MNIMKKNHDFAQIIFVIVVCRITANSEPQNRLCTAAKLVQPPRPPTPPVRTEQAAVSELTSEPLSVCVPLSLPACLTDGLFVLLVSVCAVCVSRSAGQYRPWTCKKKEGSLLCILHMRRNVVSHLSVHKASGWSANEELLCVPADQGINQLEPFSHLSTYHWLLLHPNKTFWNRSCERNGGMEPVHASTKRKAEVLRQLGGCGGSFAKEPADAKEEKKKTETVCKNNCSWSLRWLPDNWPQTRKHTTCF